MAEEQYAKYWSFPLVFHVQRSSKFQLGTENAKGTYTQPGESTWQQEVKQLWPKETWHHGTIHVKGPGVTWAPSQASPRTRTTPVPPQPRKSSSNKCPLPTKPYSGYSGEDKSGSSA